jgi:hypothetical protein
VNSVQINPNKTKQNCLDFLGFIRPNRDFSKGYERKNKKNRLTSQVVRKTSHARYPPFTEPRGPPQRALHPVNDKSIQDISELCKIFCPRRVRNTRRNSGDSGRIMAGLVPAISENARPCEQIIDKIIESEKIGK